MELDLSKTSGEKLVVKLSEQVSFELRKPKVGEIRLFEKNKAVDTLGAAEVLMVGCGMPQPQFDDLDIDQLEPIIDGLVALFDSKKK